MICTQWTSTRGRADALRAPRQLGPPDGAVFWLDLEIIVLTMFRVLFDRNAC